MEKVSDAEKVLNWQTKNSIAQNKVLSTIKKDVAKVHTCLERVENKVDKNVEQVDYTIRVLEQGLSEIKYTYPALEISPIRLQNNKLMKLISLKDRLVT